MVNILNIYDKTFSLILLDQNGTVLSEKVLILKPFITYQQLISQINDNEKIDIIIFWHPEYYFVPIGIENSAAFTICCVGDWNVNFINLHDSLKRFDHIITDYKGIRAFGNYNFSNVSYFPIFSLRIPDYSHVIGIEKEYDILFIGNINQNVQTDRNRYLYRIAKLSDKYKVLLTGGIYGDEYEKLICKSRIIFNRSIRGELNARVFEAMAAGSMFFLEEENKEYQFYLTPGKEFVAYNSENLETLIDYYLNNPEEIQIIVNNASQFFKDNNTQKFKNDFYNNVLELFNNRKNSNRFFSNFSEQDKHISYYREAMITLDQNILSFLNNQLPLADDYIAEIKNLKVINLYKNAEGLNQTLSYFEQSIKLFPKYFPLRINYLSILLENLLIEKALIFINQSLELLEQEKFTIENFKGVFFKELYTRFHSEYERIFAYSDKHSLLDRLKKIFSWKLFFELAKINADKNEYSEAIKYFNLAESILASSIIKNHLGIIYEKTGELDKAYEYYNQAFSEDLFNFNNLSNLIDLEEKTGYSFKQPVDRDWLTVVDASPMYQFILDDKANYKTENIKHKLEIIELYPDNKNLINNLADKILNIDNTNYQALILKGKIYYQENNFKQAVEIFAKILSIKKNNEILGLTINCLKELGDTNTIERIIKGNS